jgi:hypothetical protein
MSTSCSLELGVVIPSISIAILPLLQIIESKGEREANLSKQARRLHNKDFVF